MIEFFNRIFGRHSSSSTAKERLRLVLLSDHIALAPELIEDLKRELVDVISRFVEVDRSKIEVNFEQQDKAVAMLANIPILSVRPTPPPVPPPTTSNGQTPPKPRKRRKRTTPTSNPAPAT
ncbi:MAG: cell division topological specificity factor MinE [Candidatus Meridianibacter frigidus]|nr:MAG: cell division topological specificity factor MinE [Candidatus Eremiobacteraeota bacterium]